MVIPVRVRLGGGGGGGGYKNSHHHEKDVAWGQPLIDGASVKCRLVSFPGARFSPITERLGTRLSGVLVGGCKTHNGRVDLGLVIKSLCWRCMGGGHFSLLLHDWAQSSCLGAVN